MPGDVIVKQGDIGREFYLLVEGLAEVAREKADYAYFDFRETRKYFGDTNTWMKDLQQKRDQTRKVFIGMVNRSKTVAARR